ncbi:MAG: ATP-binding cassette domain-containing protein [Treponemataceae bacterium]
MISYRIVKTFQRLGHKKTPPFRLETERRIESGVFLGISGPSGCGKSTLLRCLAGLEHPDDGFIVDGKNTWYDSTSELFLPPQKRGVGFVFQDYALFPHLTVLGNVAYATGNRSKAKELLELTRLSEHAAHFPGELSGGQRQRTALARALARNPDLLLLDEPLSALDEALRLELGNEIRRIQRETGITAVMVSHSATELARLCDQTIMLDGGFAKAKTHSLVSRPVSPVPYPPKPSSSSRKSAEQAISTSAL